MRTGLKFKSISSTLGIAVALLHPGIGLADIIIQNVTAVTDMGSLNTNTTPDKMVDGSGLTGGSLDSFAGLHDDADSTGWKSLTTKGTITFNLGALYVLDAFGVWNHAQLDGDRGVRDVLVEISADGVNFSPLVGGPTQFARAPSAPVSAEVFTFPDVSAAYVRFDVFDGYGAINTGIAEVRFRATAASVPEPDAFSLLFTSLCLASLLLWRRRRAILAARLPRG